MNAQTLFDWNSPDVPDFLRGNKPFGVSSYPCVPGHKARATSRSAAAAIAPRQRKLQERCLWALTGGSLTADEIAQRLSVDKGSIRPRCSELALPTKKRPALIEDSGVTRRNKSGKSAIVWQLRKGAL